MTVSVKSIFHNLRSQPRNASKTYPREREREREPAEQEKWQVSLLALPNPLFHFSPPLSASVINRVHFRVSGFGDCMEMIFNVKLATLLHESTSGCPRQVEHFLEHFLC